MAHNATTESSGSGDVVLSVLAHPDDAEFLCAGTLFRLVRECNWHVHIASMTPGDCGSVALGPEEIAAVRREEGRRAAALLGGEYHCLEEPDLRICYQDQTLEKVVRLIRTVRPRLVLTHSPTDYLVDHEQTSLITRAAVFAAGVPNFLSHRQLPPPLQHIPYLYYCDAIEGKDPLGHNLRPSVYVDISAVLKDKEQALAAHASQREWLRAHHGMDQYLEAMRSWSRHRGAEIAVQAAEGFRQHLGHSYPQDDLLSGLLVKRSYNLSHAGSMSGSA